MNFHTKIFGKFRSDSNERAGRMTPVTRDRESVEPKLSANKLVENLAIPGPLVGEIPG